jgi:hypothetical protein
MDSAGGKPTASGSHAVVKPHAVASQAMEWSAEVRPGDRHRIRHRVADRTTTVADHSPGG